MPNTIDSSICEFSGGDVERYTYHTTILPVNWQAFAPPNLSPIDDNRPVAGGFDVSKRLSTLSVMTLDRIRLKPKKSIVGENVFTLSLAPQETVVLSQKSYTKQKTTLEEAIGSEFEMSEETSSTNSSELTDSTQTQLNEANAFSLNTTVSGSYGAPATGSVEASVSAGYNSSESLQNTKQNSVKKAVQSTRKAAAKSRNEHKTTFKVETESYSEAGSRRTIKNINTRRSLMLKYYKVFQQYLCSVERYDVRLCWCPVIKTPGTGVSKVKASVEAEDAAFLELKDWLPATLRPKPTDITVSSDPVTVVSTTLAINEQKLTQVNVPDGYEIKSVELQYLQQYRERGAVYEARNPSGVNNAIEYNGKRGKVDIYWHVQMDSDPLDSETIVFLTKVVAAPTSEAIAAWNGELESLKTKEREERRITLDARKKQRDQVQSYAGFDAVTELMRRVVSENISDEARDEFSEIQKWHEVFDWEGMSYVLYPNWWNTDLGENSDGSQSKRTTFLNASWAKLQIPVYRGREAEAIRLITGGIKPGPVTQAISTFVSGISTLQRDKYNESEAKFEVLNEFTENVPTDGTYLEPVLGQCESADNTLSIDIAIDQAKRASDAGVDLADMQSLGEEP